ncbi:RNA ligase/cyclic nucleotide phosphodiesterase [Peziza echinospora]|nr:RNA ligase/cyclic nucleotide phosphodiesterase [Peziza echinospora]
MPKVYTAIGTDLTNSFVDLSGISIPTSPDSSKHTNMYNMYNRRRQNPSADNSSISSSSSRSGNTSDSSDYEDENDGRIKGLRGGGGDWFGDESAETEEEEEFDSTNPYNLLLKATDCDLARMQTAYTTHRTARNLLSRNTILSPTFPGPTIDPLLSAVVAASPSPTDLLESDSVDPRHCLVVWARPPTRIKILLQHIQARLLSALTGIPTAKLWTMPQDRLHITVLEVTHSTTPDAVDALVKQIGRTGFRELVKLPVNKNVGLGIPFLSYDKAALAVSFVPVERATSSEFPAEGQSVDAAGRSPSGSKKPYTYHHLRRDVFDTVKRHGIEIDSRYVVPSAHITIARFITPSGTDAAAAASSESPVVPELMPKWIEAIDEINAWLATPNAIDEFLTSCGYTDGLGGYWSIEELVPRRGRLWYGGGESVPA